MPVNQSKLHPDQFPRCAKHNVPLELTAGWHQDAQDPAWSRLNTPTWHCPRGHEAERWVLTPYAQLEADRKTKKAQREAATHD